MQNVFYKIKYNVIPKYDDIEEYITYDLNDAIKQYNFLKEINGIINVRFFIVNNTEEELTESQIPKIN